MNKNDVLFVGVGQAGGNLVSDLMKRDRRYKGLFINTCHNDFVALDNATDKYIIANADGTGKNRKLAKQYARNDILSIVDEIKKYPMAKVIYFVFSTGGGSGSGITPVLMDVMKNRIKIKKKICGIIMMPSIYKSIQAQNNGIECWNELMQNNCFDSLLVLDNSKAKGKNSESQINESFCDLFDNFMEMSTPHKDGVIDTHEIEILGTTKGLTFIYELENSQEHTKIKLAKAMANNVFGDYQGKYCQYIGISSIKGQVEEDIIISEFNGVKDNFITYNDKKNLVVLGGCIPSLETTELLQESIKENLKEIPDDIDFSQFIVDNSTLQEEKQKIKEKNIEPQEEKDDLDEKILDDSYWDNILNL